MSRHNVNKNICPQSVLSTIAFVAISVLPLCIDSLNPRAGSDQLLTDYDATTYDNISFPGIEPPPISETARGIDERSLWKLLSDKKYNQLDQMIQRFKGTYPDWQPPEDLIAAKIRGEIKEAVITEDHNRLIRLSQNNPAAFTCDDTDHLWSLGNALHANNNEQALIILYRKNAFGMCRSGSTTGNPAKILLPVAI